MDAMLCCARLARAARRRGLRQVLSMYVDRVGIFTSAGGLGKGKKGSCLRTIE